MGCTDDGPKEQTSAGTPRPVHVIDRYLSGVQVMHFTAEQKDEILANILTEYHGPRKWPPPPPVPAVPEMENVEYVPYHPHTWEKKGGDDYPYSRICSVCGDYPYSYEPEDDTDYDCWKQMAEMRNADRNRAYQIAMVKYRAQMEYWEGIRNPEYVPGEGAIVQ